jgi:hypothetical protein
MLDTCVSFHFQQVFAHDMCGQSSKDTRDFLGFIFSQYHDYMQHLFGLRGPAV